MSETLRPQWLGRLEYRWAHRLQHLRREAIVRGSAPEALWLLEHNPVVTTGRRSVEQLPQRGIPVVRTERGGLATWHGPGQLMAYVLVDLRARGLSVKGLVAGMEDAVMTWLASMGVKGQRRCGYPGVWVGPDKICAVGIHIRRGVSMHGLALNLHNDMTGYADILPCGITDGGLTTVALKTGEKRTPQAVSEEVGAALVDALGLRG